MTISKEDIEKLAQLARIELPESEKDALVKDMDNIIAFVDELKTADVNLDDHATVGIPHNILREDAHPHEGGEYTEALLHNAPAREGNFVKVKNIL
ncbi:Asp-tRNA(Asn)/Glu-tRNA(Gln) amidotransferase subunit GatC [Candidatus Campbellbacteria bacterium]|nr:MAG: Asp-tRNA(Asn)/Glu-tRNA(Gln) amidotransferase subunit GatC [Candidatus Campbellbacteria bacterium]